MIDVGGTLVNPAFVVSAKVDNRFYANGSAAFLVVQLSDGQTIRREHGYGFDAYATLQKLEDALK